VTVTDRVVVVGGGFAGLAAACRLAGDGLRPVLLERAPHLGGRAASFHDRVTGEEVDYGHHVSMRCCTATHGLLQRIRATSCIRYQEELRVPILCGKLRSELRSNPLLPGPLHLAPAILRYRCLSARERARIARAAVPLLWTWRDVAFGPWLRERGQGSRAVARLWDPICVATLNAHVDDVSVAAARQVFRDGFFSSDGAGLGLFAAPLGRIFEAGAAYVESRGGEVLRSCAVSRIVIEANAVRGVALSSGETIDCRAVIASVAPWDLVRLVDARSFRDTLEAAGRLGWAPIVDGHVWFDRPVLGGPFAIAVDSAVQALFDVTEIHGDSEASSHHLVLSQSAAAPLIDRPAGETADALIASLGEIVPAVRGARVERRLVIRHRRATFVPAPGSERLRPSAQTSVVGLYLAGDWTATGWPSTIEGAVRSGIAAAARAAGDLERDEGAEDVRPGHTACG
jgi:squalene-associated FAD-dependent desaturase